MEIPAIAHRHNSSRRETFVIPAPLLSSFPMEASLLIAFVQHPNSNGYMSLEKMINIMKNDRDESQATYAS